GTVRGRGRPRPRRRPRGRRARARGPGGARRRCGLRARRRRGPRARARRRRAARAGARRPARGGLDARRTDLQRGCGVRGRELTGGKRRLCDRRQSCPADERLGAIRGRPRARDVPEAVDGAAAERGGARARALDGRRARRSRGHARARAGGRAMKQLAAGFRPYEWAESTDALASRAGLDPVNIVRLDGDVVAVPPDPTYPLFRVAAELAGATVGDDDPALTFCCRPGNPLGDLPALPAARPLVVDEAYFEYAGETAVPLIDDGVIVIRTF